MDTDAPANRPFSVQVSVANEGNTSGAASLVTWVRGADSGAQSLTLPASFAIVPGSSEGTAGSVRLVVTASLGPGIDGTPATTFRRTAIFDFTPHEETGLRVFLAAACGNLAVGCTSVPASQCTLSVRCEELGQTCGDNATCVSTMPPSPPVVDGSVVVPDVSTGPGDATSDIGIPDIAVGHADLARCRSLRPNHLQCD